MAYANPENQQAAWRRYYEKNSDDVKRRARENNAKAILRNQEHVNALKSEPCSDCGKSYPPYVMQFDHIGTDKEFNVSSGVRNAYSIARLQAEISKCELVCANCHAARTWLRRQPAA